MPDDDHSLRDSFGRRISYVRFSVTDRCDLRCVYCMAEDMTFLPRNQILTLEEFARLGRIFAELGVAKVRVTGGEPLSRCNVIALFEALGKTNGLRDLTLTTNGTRLARFAAPLKRAGVTRINISLDSLDPGRFRRITRVGELEKVLDGIETARYAGFERLKINSVIQAVCSMILECSPELLAGWRRDFRIIAWRIRFSAQGSRSPALILG